MKNAIICAVLLVACGKSAEDQAREDVDKQQKEHPELAKAPPPERKGPPPAEVKPDAPPAPEPTSSADIEKAFKQAMIDQKDKDVLKYCDMMKLDEKSSIQSLMGCTLSACRTKNADLGKKYAGLLPSTKDGKALHDQAVKICSTSGVQL
jgi:hypothetical protein